MQPERRGAGQLREKAKRFSGFPNSLSWANDKVNASTFNLNMFLFNTHSKLFSAAVTTAELSVNHTLSAPTNS